MRAALFIVAAMSLSLCSTGARAQLSDPLLMRPSSDWVIDYAEGSCGLRRTFVAGEDQLNLELRQSEHGDDFEVRLVSDSLAVADGSLRIRFDPDDELFEPAAAFRLRGGEARGIMYHDNLRPAALKRSSNPSPSWSSTESEARERAITGLSVFAGFEKPITLQTGSMHEPMEAMRTCLDDLATQWGLNPAIQRNLSRTVQPVDLSGLAQRIMSNSVSYLPRDRQRREVKLRVIVGADGKPTSCFTSKSSMSAKFDERACDIVMRRGRFEPALDASKTPVSSTYTVTIVVD